jgi:hypothetical protein
VLRVEVYINRRKIASAHAMNVSELAPISDYVVSGVSEENPVAGLPQMTHALLISGHDREQSPWALVSKIAEQLAVLERDRAKYVAPPLPSKPEHATGKRDG